MKSFRVVEVTVHPRARQSRVERVPAGRFKIHVTAPPMEGQANEAAREALAEALGVSKRDVELVSGATSRRKRFRVRGTP